MSTASISLRELTVRYAPLRGYRGPRIQRDTAVADARSAAAIFAAILRDEAIEIFGLLCLSTKHRVIAYHEVSRGTLDATLVHPREVFKAALLANAAGVIAAHNHPSGDPSPSPDDIAVTKRLAAAGTLLGIPVLDHVIIGNSGRHYSFREAGLIQS